MAQLSISFGIGFESRSNNNQSFVKDTKILSTQAKHGTNLL